MITSPLETANAIYGAAARVQETIHFVNDSATEYLYKQSRILQSQLKHLDSESVHVLDVLQKLTWFTNIAVTTPMPLGSSALQRFCTQDELLELLNQTSRSYPDCTANVQDTVRALKRAFVVDLTDIAVKVCELVQENDRVALITGRQWLNTAVLEHIEAITGRDDIALIRTSDLRKDSVYDIIIVTSPPSWIEPQVRNAIRSRKRDIVTLSLFQQDTSPVSVLPENWNPVITSKRQTRAATVQLRPHDESGNDLTAQDSSEGFELATIIGRVRNSQPTAEPSAYAPLGDAEAFHLANGAVVLLPSDGRTWTVDQDGETFIVTQRIPADIQSGEFIVLRTQRDRDLIAEIADQQLGATAAKLRSLQSLWKQNLQRRIQERGLIGLSRDMTDYGMGPLSSPGNVRRWAGNEFIRNQKREDWDRLMKFLGLSEVATQLWDAMEIILDAHRKAGFLISNVIRTQLQSMSLTEIRDSMQLPPMPALGNERLTLYLIQDRLGLVRDIPFTHMNRVVAW